MVQTNATNIQIEIAAAAARLIAEQGLDYASAKRKALHWVVGRTTQSRNAVPDNALVEAELRRWLTTFDAPRHGPRLRGLRLLALHWMQQLSDFKPYVLGAVLNGTATEHSDVRLDLYADSAKEVEFFLLNQGITFETQGQGLPDGCEECLSFVVSNPPASAIPARVGIVLAVFPLKTVRSVSRHRRVDAGLHPIEACAHASVDQLKQLLAETESA